uniref:GTPase IMAP family member 8 n=1 Tax=Iconisemion striatum TaxID=60296 RepID=A0A1A7YGF9_9TELE
MYLLMCKLKHKGSHYCLQSLELYMSKRTEIKTVAFTEPLRIMLLGKSGAGKSSSGNTILNKMVFKSDMKLKRVTVHCEKEVGMAEDTPVTVIDTPGLFEKDRDKEVIVREILKRVKLQEPGPHVFVFVVPLGRMTQEDQHTHTLIEARFGRRVWDFTIVLFTHGDRLEGTTINNVITESDDNLRSFIRKCSGGFHVFNNKNPEDQTQVVRFMEKIQTLVALNGGGHYHAQLYPHHERLIRERQLSILAERSEVIDTKEKDLQNHHQGEELDMKIRELWRKEEENARRAAERQFRNNKILKFTVLPVFSCLLFGRALKVPDKYLITVTIVWTGMCFKIASTYLSEMFWFSKEK